MKKSYQVLSKEESRKLAEHLAKEGQYLLPMVELIEGARLAVDELIDVMGRHAVEAVLMLSARGAAGAKHQGKPGGEIVWHGTQGGRVPLSDRKLRITRPRLRRKGGGEEPIPAYEAMRSSEAPGRRILEILMHGVSTRSFAGVIPEMAETAGVSKSAVSREFVEASEAKWNELLNRRYDDLDLLILYLDGLVFGEVHVIAAVGVASDGTKHVLGVVEGASENAASCKSLLESLVERGVDPDRRYLFVIDGSKALRKAIDQVFGSKNPVQRCRNHKAKNVCDKLPDEVKDQVKAALKAAWRLDEKEGLARLRKQADWLEAMGRPDAAASLREGLEETFTINRLGLPPSLRRCLGTTNLIESPNAGVRQKTRRVSRWKDGKMVLRWAATAFLATEKRFRKIMGYKDLWMLQSALKEKSLDAETKAA